MNKNDKFSVEVYVPGRGKVVPDSQSGKNSESNDSGKENDDCAIDDAEMAVFEDLIQELTKLVRKLQTI